VRLERELSRLETFEQIGEGFRLVTDSVANAMQQMVTGVLRGTQSLGDALDAMLQNILIKIAVDFIDKGIRGLMEEMISIVQAALAEAFAKEQTSKLIGAIIQGVSFAVGGGFGAATSGAGTVGPTGALQLNQTGFSGGFGSSSGLQNFNAGGGIATVPGAQHGGVFDRPNIIGIAEKEPEAVIPLSKLPSLLSGIKGGSKPVSITINNNTSNNVNAEANERQDEIDISLTIDTIMAGNILQGNGPTSRVLQSKFGLSPRGNSR